MKSLLLVLTLAGAGGCSGQSAPVESSPASPARAPAMTETAAVRDLPFAAGESFATLDAYLAHLRKQGAFDVPFYEEVEPGVYELNGGRRRPGQPAQRFTRAQLLERYGFER